MTSDIRLKISMHRSEVHLQNGLMTNRLNIILSIVMTNSPSKNGSFTDLRSTVIIYVGLMTKRDSNCFLKKYLRDWSNSSFVWI